MCIHMYIYIYVSICIRLDEPLQARGESSVVRGIADRVGKKELQLGLKEAAGFE